YGLGRSFTGVEKKEVKIFSKEPAKDGPGKGEVVDQDKLLDIMYEIKGWDKNGIPTKEKLAELELDV
ncbi:aldehyde ferredoxin oxidoreductase C-terminal domain-containing protein, partial [Thermovenabulum sp.]|uniref:aldehyde ferredoxin oxidoreductase C-terminal domain-containing protein n=1 Tax=Thermovenabulum sp. TaxID=3100335 RepID=UPI003C7CB27B